MRVSNQIAHHVSRTLPRRFDNAGAFGGSTKAIGTTAPTGKTRRISMGIVGADCMLTISPDTAADITLYVWSPHREMWLLGGANSTQHTKTYEQDSMDGWSVPEGSDIFLKASVVVEDCYVDVRQSDANKDA